MRPSLALAVALSTVLLAGTAPQAHAQNEAPARTPEPTRAQGDADRLSAGETDRLARGETVIREQALQRGGHHYVGGVAYALVDAQADALAEMLDDVGVWQRILPRTRAARRVGTAGDDALVELTSGTALVQATYTMRLRREGDFVRFWMEPSRRHDIEDAWGFVRVSPASKSGAPVTSRTLMTYGVLIDLGPGIMRDLFEDRVRQLALSVPDRLRGLIFERSAAGQRASR